MRLANGQMRLGPRTEKLYGLVDPEIIVKKLFRKCVMEETYGQFIRLQHEAIKMESSSVVCFVLSEVLFRKQCFLTTNSAFCEGKKL